MKRLRSSRSGAWRRGLRALFFAGCLMLAGCSRRERQRSPAPRPTASGTAAPRSLCAGGGGSISVPAFEGWFPRTAGAYCIDPNADQRVFGVGGTLPVTDAAEVLSLDGDELARSAPVTIVAIAYVEDKAEPGRVTASVLSFADPDAAYAFFTRRIADAAELGRPAFETLDAGAAGVVGETTAFVVRAQTVLRLEFANGRLPPARLAAVARPVLVSLAKDIGARLPGAAKLPIAAELLPALNRVPLSLRYYAADLAGFQGIGPGALATYVEGSRRYRVALAVRHDADAGKDVLSTLRKRDGSRVLKREPYDASRVAEIDDATGAVREWIFGRKGAVVAGVALDVPPRAVPKGTPPEREAAVLKMKRLLDRLPAAPAW